MTPLRRLCVAAIASGLAPALAGADTELIASGAHERDLFGSIVAATPDRIVAPIPARLPGLKGLLALFERSGASWLSTATIDGTVDGDGFGSAVALDNDLLAIGIPLYRVSYTSQSLALGRIVVRHRDAQGEWPEIYSLAGSTDSRLGSAVAVSGNWLVASAPFQKLSQLFIPPEGRVRFFKFDGAVVTPGTVIDAPNGSIAAFGRTLAMSGDWAAAGGSLFDPFPGQAGCVQLMSRQPDDTWALGPLLTAAVPAADDAFGSSLAMSGDLLVIGAPAPEQIDPNADGFVAVYRLNQGAWNLEATLVAPTADYCRHFGSAVALNGNTIAVGAATGEPSQPYAGIIHLFSHENGVWVHGASTPGAADETLGAALAFSGSDLVVGVPGATVSGDEGPILRAGKIEVLTMIPGDLNGDGHVNGADLSLLLADWGAIGSPADLNGDGVVNGGDLGILLGSWQ